MLFFKTSHPRLLPQSLKDCSIHLCVFFCFAYRVIGRHMKICKLKKTATRDERGERKKIKERKGKEWREGENWFILHLGQLEAMERWKGGWDVAFRIMIACHHGILMTIKILLQSVLCDSLSYGYSLGSTIWEPQRSPMPPLVALVSTRHPGHPGSKWAKVAFTSGRKVLTLTNYTNVSVPFL